MANWISQQKGKINSHITNFTNDGSSVLTSELNKLWRAKILLNRLTSGQPQDIPIQGKSYIPNTTLTSYGTYGPIGTNPSVNKDIKETSRRSRLFLQRGKTNVGFPKDTPVELQIEHNRRSHIFTDNGQESLIETLDHYNRLKNKIIIFNLNGSKGYQKIVLQNRPNQIDFRGETSWATIKSMGRNTPLYHYTGSEDTLQFNISWYCNSDNYQEVVVKCRLLESWSKSDGYRSGPPILRIDWGGEEGKGLFGDSSFILTSATYTLLNFQSGNFKRSVTSNLNSNLKDTKLYPMAATQELIFKRVSDHSLTYNDIVSETDLNKVL